MSSPESECRTTDPDSSQKLILPEHRRLRYVGAPAEVTQELSRMKRIGFDAGEHGKSLGNVGAVG